MIHKSIGILGCGWLGKALAKFLVSQDFQVTGSTTNSAKLGSLEKEGIEPYLIQLPENVMERSPFWEVEVLVIAFPPSLRKGKPRDYLEKIACIQNQVRKHNYKKVIFIGSTSVYTSDETLKKEEDADLSHTLLKAEIKLKRVCEETGTAFISARCGGLMGYDRFPCKYFSLHKEIAGANSKVNYIHRDDVVSILSQLIRKKTVSGVFNLVCDEHPSRKEVLINCFQRQQGSKPEFSKESRDFKIVNNSKIKVTLDYTFKYSNPLNFYYEF